MSTILLDDDTAVEAKPATFWIRFAAALLDFLIILLPSFLAFYFTAFSPNLLAVILVNVLVASYKPVLEGAYGATVGKMACKIEVTNVDGEAITWGQALMRYLPWVIGVLINIYVATVTFGSDGFGAVDGFMSYSMFVAEAAELQRLSRIQQLVGLLPLASALVIFFTKKNQAAHDVLAETLVVYRKDS